jgi:DNA end-binding protein Ku
MKQQYFCPLDNEVVERSDMARGYEYAKDQYVVFNEEELDALESPKNNSLEILEFVPLDSVDLLYVAKTYYLGPDKGGDKAYKLLSDSMQRTHKVAVGRFWTRGKEQLVLLRPYKDGLVLHYVYYANEVRAFDEVDTGAKVSFSPVESDLADKLIDQLTTDKFQPERYRDTYNDRLREAIEQKVAGQQVHLAQEQPTAQIIDLFEALKRSLNANDAAAQPANTNQPAPEAANNTEPAAPAAQDAAPAKPRPPKKAQPRAPRRTAKPATG